MAEMSKLSSQSLQTIRIYRELLLSGNETIVQSINFALAGYLQGLSDAGILTNEEAEKLMSELKEA